MGGFRVNLRMCEQALSKLCHVLHKDERECSENRTEQRHKTQLEAAKSFPLVNGRQDTFVQLHARPARF